MASATKGKKSVSLNEKILQGDETKKEILNIAKRLFGKKGFSQTSIEDILLELGLSKGALYHHFQNKRHIFFEVCKSWNERESLTLERLTWKEFKIMIPSLWDRADDPDFVQIWVRDAYSVLTPEEIFALDETYLISPLKTFLERMAKEKKIHSLPSFEEAHLLIGLLNQGLWLVSNTSKKDKKTVKENLTKILLSYIQNRSNPKV